MPVQPINNNNQVLQLLQLGIQMQELGMKQQDYQSLAEQRQVQIQKIKEAVELEKQKQEQQLERAGAVRTLGLSGAFGDNVAGPSKVGDALATLAEGASGDTVWTGTMGLLKEQQALKETLEKKKANSDAIANFNTMGKQWHGAEWIDFDKNMPIEQAREITAKRFPNQEFKEGGSYNPYTGTWQLLANMPSVTLGKIPGEPGGEGVSAFLPTPVAFEKAIKEGKPVPSAVTIPVKDSLGNPIPQDKYQDTTEITLPGNQVVSALSGYKLAEGIDPSVLANYGDAMVTVKANPRNHQITLIKEAADTEKENPNHWIAIMHDISKTPEQIKNAKDKYETYIKGKEREAQAAKVGADAAYDSAEMKQMIHDFAIEVVNGRALYSNMPNRADPGFRMRLDAEIHKLNPQFNLIDAESNGKYYTQNQAKLRGFKNVFIVLDRLEEASKIIPQGNVVALNNVKRDIQNAFSGIGITKQNLVKGLADEEITRLFGPASGGGAKFLELSKSLLNPATGTTTLVSNIHELQNLLAESFKQRVDGTPMQQYADDLLSKYSTRQQKKDRSLDNLKTKQAGGK